VKLVFGLMQVSLEQIMQMPNAAILAERLKNALEEERKKRLYFYEIIDEGKKMEFINGEIVFQSPAKLRHVSTVTLFLRLVSSFVDKHQLGYVGSEKLLISLTRNDYEPDICFFDKSKSQNFTSTQMQFPAPDFIVEVLSDSPAKTDRETKFEDYAAHGVNEYWIIDPEKEFIEQYFLQNGNYDMLLKSNSGEIRSVVIIDFVIPIRAVFDENLNLEVLGRLLAD
jgi:Uma2 family endonuclease